MGFIGEFIENFRKQPVIIQIIEVIVLIALIYDIINFENQSQFFLIAVFVLVIAELVNWFFFSEKE